VSRALISISLIALITWFQTGRAAGAQASALNLKSVEGDGATYAPGSRATRGVTVLVTDETGRPVDGATVGFSLPMTGPSGEFASGGRTEIVTTKADGRASVWGMRWNRIAGPFEIRVSAVKGAARVSIMLTQNLAGDAAKPAALSTSGGGSHKWVWIGLGGAAAVAGAVAAGAASKGSTGGSGTVASTGVVQIGAPSISLGKP
jgi:hypothetical protein